MTDAEESPVYEWYEQGRRLHANGDAAAAATVLARALRAAPESASLLEACARAQYDAGQFGDASESFRRLVDRSPDADYARFGYGLALSRLGRFTEAVEHLEAAAVMRPDRTEYLERLRQVRATVRARRDES
ncbi:tetratricopeptide repeat protein [Thalassiella azotivora]